MKATQNISLLHIGVILLFVGVLDSCHKDKEAMNSGTPAQQPNRTPVANAGADISVNLVSCYSGRTAELDGSASYDPDNSFIDYGWRKISGPFCILSSGATPAKAHLSQLVAGQYAFELRVTDEGSSSSKGLSSRDTVVVNVTGSASPTEINLDETINGSFLFRDNYEECDEEYSPFGSFYYCVYTDITTITGRFSLSLPLGQINFGISENADTATASDNHDTRMDLSCNTCVPSRYLSGSCSINFKKLIQQGGGSFNGTIKIEHGSAKDNCDQNVFDNLLPLTVTGIMDTTAHTVNLTIKGKVYF